MNDHDIVEVLLVEDNPQDAELTIRALKRHNLANRLIHVEDGAEALDFLFGRGKYEGRRIDISPRRFRRPGNRNRLLSCIFHALPGRHRLRCLQQ